MTSQNFASKSGSLESLKTRVRCGLISFSLQTRCTVALETPNSRAIERQGPSGPTLRWSRGLIDDAAQDLRAKVAFATRAGLILQRSQPTTEIAPSPLRDLVKVHADLLSDGADSHSLSSQLYDSRSLRQALRRLLGAYQLPKLLFFSGTQHKLSTLLGHRKHPSIFLLKCHYYLRDTTLAR